MENDPIADDELLYRRVPVSKGWHDDAGLSPEAFDPRPNEESGISVYRANFITIEKAAQGKSKQGYWVAVLRAAIFGSMESSSHHVLSQTTQAMQNCRT